MRSMPHEPEMFQVDNTLGTVIYHLKHLLIACTGNFNGTVVIEFKIFSHYF